MNLPDYIKQVGAREFAAKFHIGERRAISYQRKERLPRPELAQEIVERTPVTWEGIYGPQARAS